KKKKLLCTSSFCYCVTHQDTILKSTTMNSVCIILQLVLLILLCVVMSNLVFGEVEINCIESERETLLKIKGDLIDKAGYLSSWGSEDNKRECCTWRGIRCNKQTGHIEVLNLNVTDFSKLEHIPLRGKISRSLIELKYLKVLNLGWNDFSDQLDISEFIGFLSPNIIYLDLSFSLFGGPFPSQVGNLSALQYLNIDENFFQNAKNLESFSRLSSLKILDLSFSNLSEANLCVLKELPSLKGLSLRDCGIQDVSLISSLSCVNNTSSSLLERLDLSGNGFSSLIYKWLFNIGKSLMHLDLSGNQLQGAIPKSMGNLCSLRHIFLDGNKISGKFDELFGNLSGCMQNFLEHLSLSFNQLSGTFSDNISEFSSLNILDLSENLLVGSLPNIASFFPSLTKLNLDGNQFTGIPGNSFSGLFHLDTLSIADNSFKGILTETHLSDLFRLKELYLSRNSQLSLRINSDSVPPFQLNLLQLQSVKLGPKFPNWIKLQRNLTFLDMSNAEIPNTIPTWVWNTFPRLTFFNLSHNRISGKLPPDLSTISFESIEIDLSFNNLEGPLPLFPFNLTYLDLSKNRFSGPLSILSKITPSISCIDLSDNMLSGNIPQIQCQSLFMLNLANNKLSGKIPNWLMQNWGFNSLILANNSLSGEIPSTVGNLSNLQVLDLRNNNLSGELPSSLQKCKALESLDLGDNKLFGEIPSWIGEMLHLKFLILRSNGFYGRIPLQICQLTDIKILDISINNISGIIPECFSNFSMMALQTNLRDLNFSLSSPIYFFQGRPWCLGEVTVFSEGRQHGYGRSTRELLRVIDLSSNKLTGNIPSQFTNFSALVALNLSQNCLNGTIPLKIGMLKELMSLDLSRNYLSGDIPSSVVNLTFLNHLDLSYNNFSGKIPSSTQLQSFNASKFIGNPFLCGLPLQLKCPGEKSFDQSQPTNNSGAGTVHEDEDEFEKWFYTGMGIGFAVGFWAICGSLILKHSWRHAYFRLMLNIKDWIYVMIVVHWARLRRRFQS
ncbi:Leucine-rich repeat receptor protein kinase, partial [Quillaja saponaria]